MKSNLNKVMGHRLYIVKRFMELKQTKMVCISTFLAVYVMPHKCTAVAYGSMSKPMNGMTNFIDCIVVSVRGLKVTNKCSQVLPSLLLCLSIVLQDWAKLKQQKGRNAVPTPTYNH